MLGVVLAQSPSPSVPASPLPDIETGLPAAKVAAVEALISAAMTRLGIPGFSAAVVTERRLRWSNAFGTADLENFVPAKNVTVYRLASVTKPIAATAVLQLVEAGKVDVEGVSGKPFLEYLDERVFAPAGMEAARGDDVLAIIPNRAAGYQMGAGGELRNSPMSDTSNRTAGGRASPSCCCATSRSCPPRCWTWPVRWRTRSFASGIGYAAGKVEEDSSCPG